MPGELRWYAGWLYGVPGAAGDDCQVTCVRPCAAGEPALTCCAADWIHDATDGETAVADGDDEVGPGLRPVHAVLGLPGLMNGACGLGGGSRAGEPGGGAGCLIGAEPWLAGARSAVSAPGLRCGVAACACCCIVTGAGCSRGAAMRIVGGALVGGAGMLADTLLGSGMAGTSMPCWAASSSVSCCAKAVSFAASVRHAVVS